MTQGTSTTTGNGSGYSAMPSSTTKRLEQDDRLHEHRDMETDARLDGGKSSAQLEREVERERAELTGTLEEIRRSLSPGQLVDQAFEYARHSGGREFAENLGRSVRDNPLPVLLMGAGAAWLMATDRGGRPRTSSGSSAPDIAAGMSNAAGSASHAASDMAASARKGAGHVSDAASGLASSASHAASGVASSASHAAERAGELAHDARDTVSHAGSQLRSGWSWLAQEQPLVLGALGVAVGAAIAAALPSTRTEDRLMGETSDSVKDQIRQTARHEYEHAKEVASETAGEISDDLDRRGLTPESATDAASAAMDKAGSAAERMVDGAEARAKSGTTDGTTQQAPSSASGSAGPKTAAADDPSGN